MTRIPIYVEGESPPLVRVCRHTEGKYHDCAQVDARNALLPAAIFEAEALVKLEPGPRRDAVVAREFFRIMQRLCVERGLVSAQVYVNEGERAA